MFVVVLGWYNIWSMYKWTLFLLKSSTFHRFGARTSHRTEKRKTVTRSPLHCTLAKKVHNSANSHEAWTHPHIALLFLLLCPFLLFIVRILKKSVESDAQPQRPLGVVMSITTTTKSCWLANLAHCSAVARIGPLFRSVTRWRWWHGWIRWLLLFVQTFACPHLTIHSPSSVKAPWSTRSATS